jgi:hypothetical protein
MGLSKLVNAPRDNCSAGFALDRAERCRCRAERGEQTRSEHMKLDLRVTVPTVASTGGKIDPLTATATMHVTFIQVL